MKKFMIFKSKEIELDKRLMNMQMIASAMKRMQMANKELNLFVIKEALDVVSSAIKYELLIPLLNNCYGILWYIKWKNTAEEIKKYRMTKDVIIKMK
jgi:hypothetical protein